MVTGGGLLRLNRGYSTRLKYCRDTVRSWIREKKLPAYRVGKEYRIKIVDYERFLQQRRTINDDPQEED